MLRRIRLIGISSVLAVGVVASGGYLVNAATAPSATITACSNTKTGAVRVIAPSKSCSKTEKRLTWNVKGATGAAGATGKTGAPGPAGPAGKAGNDGVSGFPGLDGKDGLQGPAGQDGKNGVDGRDGATGPQGPAGPAGTGAGAEVVDPNPNDLTYRMQIGSERAVEIAGFTQKLSNPGTALMGSGNADVGDVIATLPMNAGLLTQMSTLAKGAHLPTARLEMCKPGEATGHCTLELTLTEVIVAGVDVQQDPTQATATIQLNFAKEKLSYLPGTPQATTVSWNIAENVMDAPPSGSALATSTGDTTYTATLTGSTPRGVLSTRTWHQNLTQSGTTHVGGGGGAGKANFGDVTAETRTGPGTLTLFRTLVTGESLTRIELAGCETPTCTSTAALSQVRVSSLVLGSPTLFDRTEFNYGTINWDRKDHVRDVFTTFAWDVVANSAG
jgi:type VI protein secretion system component Hcp